MSGVKGSIKPEGWEKIEPTLKELKEKMDNASNAPDEGKRKNEAKWSIMKIHHQRSKYIYDKYKANEITKELYDYCVNKKFADAGLIAKWKRNGYEQLCCLECIRTSETAFGTQCICRVPKSKLEEGKLVECVNCGCRGCSG